MLHVLLQCTQKVSPWGWSWSCNKWSVTVGQKEVTNSKVSQLLERLAIAIYINLQNIISKATPLIDRLPGWLPLPNMLQRHSNHSGCPYSLGVLQARHLSMQATVKASLGASKLFKCYHDNCQCSFCFREKPSDRIIVILLNKHML